MEKLCAKKVIFALLPVSILKDSLKKQFISFYSKPFQFVRLFIKSAAAYFKNGSLHFAVADILLSECSCRLYSRQNHSKPETHSHQRHF